MLSSVSGFAFKYRTADTATGRSLLSGLSAFSRNTGLVALSGYLEELLFYYYRVLSCVRHYIAWIMEGGKADI